jgi:uncharacterized protein
MNEHKERLAFDKATVRTVDHFGRLHVAISNISKAVVNPYYGREIPDAEALGLDDSKVYQLFRDPKELEAAAPTFNNVPLLILHKPVSASKPSKELVVGSTGTDAAFRAPYLTNSLVVWDAAAIAGIESEEQCELSSAYAYKVDMTPGTFDGVAYDGRMKEIRGNHVALVEVGRAGPDVIVGDSKPLELPMKISRKAIAVKGALSAFLRPKLAQDAKLDLTALVGNVMGSTIAADQARIVKDVLAKSKDKLAQDIDIDASELGELIGSAAATEPDEPALDQEGGGVAQVMELIKGLSDEDKAKITAALSAGPAAGDESQSNAAAAGEGTTKAAMDAAIQKARGESRAEAIQTFNAIREAEKLVLPHIGEVVAQDSAEAVYKLALDAAGVDLAGVPPAAYRAMVQMLPNPDAKPVPRIAQDANSVGNFQKLFPTAVMPIRS